MPSATDELWDGLRVARRAHTISTLWKIICWACSFVLVAGFLASSPVSAPDTPCGSATKPPFGVQLTRVAAGIGDGIRMTRDAHVEPAEVKARIGQVGATIGRWLAIVVAKARGAQGQHPETAKMEAELATRQAEHDAACAPRPDLLLMAGQVYTGSPNASVATMNVLKSLSGRRVADNLQAALAKADVVGLQEVRRNHLGAIRSAIGPTGRLSNDGNAVPIAWRTDKVRLLALREQTIMSPAHVEGGRIPGKHVVWAHFQERTSGHTFWVVNNHMYWNVATGGRPDGGKPRRLAAYKTQLERIVDGYGSYPGLAKLAAGGEAVIATGDWNVDASGDAKVRTPGFPFVMMSTRGFASNYQMLRQELSTHGKATLDQIWSRGALPAGQETLDNDGSDHRILIVHYTQARQESVA